MWIINDFILKLVCILLTIIRSPTRFWHSLAASLWSRESPSKFFFSNVGKLKQAMWVFFKHLAKMFDKNMKNYLIVTDHIHPKLGHKPSKGHSHQPVRHFGFSDQSCRVSHRTPQDTWTEFAASKAPWVFFNGGPSRLCPVFPSGMKPTLLFPDVGFNHQLNLFSGSLS